MKTHSDTKLKYKIRDVIVLLVFWQCILMTLCLLYFLHNQSAKYEVNSGFAESSKNSLVNNVLYNVPIRTTPARPRYLEKIITEETLTINDFKPLTGYVSIHGNKSLELRCNTCSLVASSGQLTGKGAGADIDNADCVIRMNAAPSRGFEEDVGKRTTIRVIGNPNIKKALQDDPKMRHEILADNYYRTDYIVIPWLYEEAIDREKDEAFLIATNYSREYPDVEFYLFTEEKINITGKQFEKYVGMTRTEAHTWFSTGFVAMLFAIDACHKIDVYGLASPEYCEKHKNSSVLYHYYNDTIFKRECEYLEKSEKKLHFGHKFLTEKIIFSQWTFEHNIQFHYPSWKPMKRNLSDYKSPFLKLYNEAKTNGTLQKLQHPQKPKKLKSSCTGNLTVCDNNEIRNYTVVRTFYKNGRRVVVKRIIRVSKNKGKR